jgi:hypothetical protein
MSDAMAKIRELLPKTIEELENFTLRKSKEALALLDAERPSVPMEPLRLLYNMAALNGGIPDNRDEIITAHMAEFGIDVKG